MGCVRYPPPCLCSGTYTCLASQCVCVCVCMVSMCVSGVGRYGECVSVGMVVCVCVCACECDYRRLDRYLDLSGEGYGECEWMGSECV